MSISRTVIHIKHFIKLEQNHVGIPYYKGIACVVILCIVTDFIIFYTMLVLGLFDQQIILFY